MKKTDSWGFGKNKSVVCMLLLVAGLFCSSSMRAQLEAKTVFVNMPDSLLPYLTAVNRADFIDFLESNMKAKVENRFGNETEMTELGKDYICVRMTPQSTWQMKLLATSDTTQVICTVATACGPVCDSSIRFYTTDWAELPVSDFMKAMPVMDDFFETPDSAAAYDYNNARLQADMLLVKADLSATDNTLTLSLTTPEYMEKETADKLKPFIRRPIVYTWEESLRQLTRD